jgi:WD40 repeat protein
MGRKDAAIRGVGCLGGPGMLSSEAPIWVSFALARMAIMFLRRTTRKLWCSPRDHSRSYSRITAVRATPAQFTPDSAQIAFLSSISRVRPPVSEPEKLTPHLEWWSVAGKHRVGFFDAPTANCGNLVLSPDGRVLACDDIQGTLKLFDVPACKVLYEKRQFVRLGAISGPDEFPRQYWGDLGDAAFEFSPDGRFLLGSSEGGDSLLWDVREGAAVKPSGELRGPSSCGVPTGGIRGSEQYTSSGGILQASGCKVRVARLVSFLRRATGIEPKNPTRSDL